MFLLDKFKELFRTFVFVVAHLKCVRSLSDGIVSRLTFFLEMEQGKAQGENELQGIVRRGWVEETTRRGS